MTIFGTKSLILIFILFNIYLLNGFNEFFSDGINFWNSTTDFIPIKNASYGTIQLKTGFYMKFDIIFHGKTTNAKWENIFRIGHAGYSQNDFKFSSNYCSKNDRFPGLWIDDDSNAFVFDISDKTNCFRQYANFIITPHTFYSIIIQYNSSWIYIEINNNIIVNQPRADTTDIDKLGTDVQIWISTVTSIPANVTLSNIMILSYDDDSFTNKPTIYPTLSPSIQPTINPTNIPSMRPTSTSFPTLNPSLNPTTNPSSPKKPTTFFPTVYIPYTTTMEEEEEEESTTTSSSLFDISTTDILIPISTQQQTNADTSTTSSYINILTTYIDTHINATIIASNHTKGNGLSFEIIFYILTGCAMGGILFCVCACCCFGCIINKKMKTLGDNDEEDQDDNFSKHNNKNQGYSKNNSASNILSISNVFYRSKREKERVQTMSGDSNRTPQPMMEEEVSKLFNIAHRGSAPSPTPNRLTSPSSAMTMQSTASSTCSSDTTSSTTTTATSSLSSNGGTETTKTTKTMSNQIVDLTQNKRRYYIKHNRDHNNGDKRKSFKKERVRMTKSVPIMDANTSRDKKIKIQRKHKRDSEDIALAMEYADTLETNEEETETETEHTEDTDDTKDENARHSLILSPLKGSKGHFFECRKHDGDRDIDREQSVDNSISITMSQTATTLNHKQLARNSNNYNNTIFSNPSTTHYSLFVHKPSSPDDEDEDGTDNEETKVNDMSATTEESRTKHQRQPSKRYQIQIDFAKSNTISNTGNKQENGTEHEIITTKSMNSPNGEEDDIDIDLLDIDSIHEMIAFDNEYYAHDIKTIDDELHTLHDAEEILLNEMRTDDSSTNDEEDEDMKDDEEVINVTKGIEDEQEEEEEEEDDDISNNHKRDETAKTFLELPSTADSEHSAADSSLSAVSSNTASSSSTGSTASSSSVASTASSNSSLSSNSSSTSTTSTSSCRGYPISYTKNVKIMHPKRTNITIQNQMDMGSNMSSSSGYYRNSPQSQF